MNLCRGTMFLERCAEEEWRYSENPVSNEDGVRDVMRESR